MSEPSIQRPSVAFQRLDPRASVPQAKSELAAGLDLAACLPRGPVETGSIELSRGQIVMIPTGLAMALPAGYEGQVRPRSGLAIKHGVTVPNAPGTIDADYRGELMVGLINLGSEPFVIEHGMRIAQLVIAAVAMPEVIEVESLDETARGAGGFGSTGLR